MEGGSERGGMYVGRAQVKGEMLPGKVHLAHGALYVSHGKSGTFVSSSILI